MGKLYNKSDIYQAFKAGTTVRENMFNRNKKFDLEFHFDYFFEYVFMPGAGKLDTNNNVSVTDYSEILSYDDTLFLLELGQTLIEKGLFDAKEENRYYEIFHKLQTKS